MKEVLERLTLLTLEKLSCGQRPGPGNRLNLIFSESVKHHKQVLKKVAKFNITKLLRTVVIPKDHKETLSLYWMGGQVTLRLDADGSGMDLEGDPFNMQVFMNTFRIFEQIQTTLESKGDSL